MLVCVVLVECVAVAEIECDIECVPEPLGETERDTLDEIVWLPVVEMEKLRVAEKLCDRVDDIVKLKDMLLVDDIEADREWLRDNVALLLEEDVEEIVREHDRDCDALTLTLLDGVFDRLSENERETERDSVCVPLVLTLDEAVLVMDDVWLALFVAETLCVVENDVVADVDCDTVLV